MLRKITTGSIKGLALLAMVSCMDDAPKRAHQEGPEAKGKGFGAVPEQAGNKSYYKPLPEIGGPIGIGFGVDLDNQTGIPNTCLIGEFKTVPHQEGVQFLDADFTQSEVTSYLGGSSGGGFNFGKWGMSARGSFSHKTQENRYGLNYIVMAFVKSHSKVFVPTARTEAMAQLSSEEWLQRCGTGYVAAQDFGAMLIVRFSLNLESRSTQTNWKTSGSGNYLSIAKLKASINGNRKTKRDKGTLSVSAIQIGGKPHELGKILKSEDKAGLIQSFALCRVENVDECLSGLTSVENYLANVFPKQIDDKKEGGPSVLRTYPFIYPKTMGPDYNPGLDEYVLKARKKLSALYEAEINDIARINEFSSEIDDEAKEILEAAKANIAGIRQSTQLCYDPSTYAQCAAKAEELEIACSETNVPSGLGELAEASSNNGSNSGE